MVTVKLITAGILPQDLDLSAIENWSSSIFKIEGAIENYEFRLDSDTGHWGFSDDNLQKLKINSTANFTLILVNVPLEENYYSRRIGENYIVGTFYEVKQYLDNKNVPLHNLVLRALYAYSLLFIEAGNRIPPQHEQYKFTHHDTRGCIYDMTGNKEEVVESCSNPIICFECQERLISKRVSNHLVTIAKNEIKQIDKKLYYRAIDFIKNHPICSLALSTVFAIIVGTASSVIASYITTKIH